MIEQPTTPESPKPPKKPPVKPPKQPKNEPGNALETHQLSGSPEQSALTNQGIPIPDNQNSLRLGQHGPVLLEDFILREKITHFDHERIPERIVHARGSGAHGYFELISSLEQYTTAKVLTQVGVQTPVFARFSTVAGGAGSIDTPRDVRGFAVKFYTEDGNWDLVGNNIPVFFIQDAMKFPDLIHAVKMEPDRGFPQAASAHDTFWDFISLSPETTHMVFWAMSDRAIPRSLRMMEGFAIHSFRLINAQGESTFVKFHWRPSLGMQSTTWDETVKITGADHDYQRRDLFEAIQNGGFPSWDLAVQIFTQEEADALPFDHLDPTKLIPEEIIPLKVIGRMVLNRWPDNFFAETEQVAFCPANIVPGIDFSNDPLLQGRLFSYQDTQLIRLGGPNFHQIPINSPRREPNNYQRNGHMQMRHHPGRVSYQPNSLDPQGPRETPERGFVHFNREAHEGKSRIRPESFADHYSQARMFYNSLTESEQNHIVGAFVFELAKVEHPHIREAMISRLLAVDETVGKRVADGLGMASLPPVDKLPVPTTEIAASDKLSIHKNMKDTLEGRQLAILVDDGSDAAKITELKKAIEKEKATCKIIAPKMTYTDSSGELKDADAKLDGSPSCIFDAVAIVLDEKATTKLTKEAAAIGFASDAWIHLKAILHSPETAPLLKKANVGQDGGVVQDDVKTFITAAKTRQWDREAKVKLID